MFVPSNEKHKSIMRKLNSRKPAFLSLFFLKLGEHQNKI